MRHHTSTPAPGIGAEIPLYRRLGLALVAITIALWPFARAEALVRPANCQDDTRGANDRPGQRDVTRFCIDDSAESPWEMYSLVNMDDIRVSGANTIDVCALFNTDGDAFVDLAVCATLGSSGPDHDNLTEFRHVRLFACNDTKADRCMGSVLVPPPYNTTCEVDHPDTDPFGPAAPGGPGSDYPYDTEVLCGIDLEDFRLSGTAARLMDSCSYPSTVPNSDADDCILYSACSDSASCDDGNPCSVDSCDPSGVCVHAPGPAGACEDGLFCDGAETCNSLGFCQASGAPRSCDDEVECTIDDCDELGDACIHDPRNSLCDDGSFCTGVEECDAGSGCRAGVAPDCSDGAACTRDTCNDATGACEHLPEDAACDDGQFCNGVESCTVELGCSPGTPPNCDDGVTCTEDACDESARSCRHTAVDAACSDDLFCNGSEICDPAGGCEAGSVPNCDDGVGCTVDLCEEAGDRCTNTPDTAACDDDTFCNGSETCDPAGGCLPGTPPCEGPLVCNEATDVCAGCLSDAACDNGVYCDGQETCVIGAGVCIPGEAVRCDDAVACTVDSCNEEADRCDRAPDTAVCDNGLFCDGAEICNPSTGCQSAAAPGCDDGIACTVDACVEATDSCRHVPDDSVCDNGVYCDGEEVCSESGGCEEGEQVTCRPDSFNCSVERCDESSDRCASDFSRCVCGDREILPPEECEPPRRAGTFEDCNNLVDDDHDGATDCSDSECEPGSGRGKVCDESCRIDRLCARVNNDPAMITYSRRGGPDSLWIHGRFPVDDDVDPATEGLYVEISNWRQPIYSASLGIGDLQDLESPGLFAFRDKTAKVLGELSSRGGLYKVGIRFRRFDGQRYLVFRLRAYGDFSAAIHRVMSTQVAMGSDVASLTAEWSAAPHRWYLHQRDF